ncbi:putative ribosome assembly protein 3 protein [Erysiphe neolycopersici]|uniref:Ribosome assembly protein 3 n=1 Tax=Erysiphe neolycopersici TaxID=212602 RepID=A0A420I4P6_9PEZI|nr:putative ribosome assembly protein 3 protein [Erysiphe neolycopersici]
MPRKQSVRSGKTTRHKKRKPRTEVSESSDNDSEPTNSSQEEDEEIEDKRKEDFEPPKLCLTKKNVSKAMTDDEISAAFAEFYLKNVTNEFADDLDQLRNADDFKEDSIPVLISALQQGTSLFSIEEQRRIVMADQEIEEKKK